MNRMVFVRAAGTPTSRAAFLFPPTANVQLPNLVRIKTRLAPTANAMNQRMETR